ncbi:MAG: insulinase family protein [candidate division Zixibacteria bacterium]|nr:insulinase family protein [candidate division Zixibacteria bacterium]
MARRPSQTENTVYNKTVLKNGLRVVTEKMPSVRSISLGVWLDVGSRNESAEENGLSHFIEHMLFKGTKTRTARQIAASLESIGGGLNAFTSREQTCYVARILDEHLNIAVDVLADMVCNSTLSPVNLGREKKVICEEIKESLDTPTDYIHDLFARTFWGKHPLGRPIMGSIRNISQMPRHRVTGYLKRNYRAGSTVIAASGFVPHDRLVKLVRGKFRFDEGAAPAPVTAARDRNRNIIFKEDDNQQTHLCLGFPGLDYAADGKTAALVLSLYLGGGMSSVLFQKIREDRGLAYTVYTFMDFYRDSGLFGAYLGTDHRRLKEAADIMLAEFARMKKRRLAPGTLEKAKNQLKGNIVLGMEATQSRMNRLGRQELMYGEFRTLERTLKEIDRVSSSDILELSNRLFDTDRMAIAVLGPADRKALNHVG